MITIVTGDFNAGSTSGVYDYMRLGYYDCLKLSRKYISGQLLGTYALNDKLFSSALMRGNKNMDVVPVMDKEAT